MFDRMNRPDPKDPIQDSHLIQRLEKPFGGFGQMKDNPFSFGGGLVNGGLGEPGMARLRDIFSFDYMGASEFEWGAVPTALNNLAKNHRRLVPAAITIPYVDVERPYRFRGQVPEGVATVYVLAYENDLNEVARRIRAWAKGEQPSSVEYPRHEMHLKEQTRLNSSLLLDDEYPSRICGWLELDNGFFFFTDREMWERTAALFEVKLPKTVKEVA